MGFLNNILKIFLGNKSKKDLKSLYPTVSKINSYSESYNKISNDEALHPIELVAKSYRL